MEFFGRLAVDTHLYVRVDIWLGGWLGRWMDGWMKSRGEEWEVEKKKGQFNGGLDLGLDGWRTEKACYWIIGVRNTSMKRWRK